MFEDLDIVRWSSLHHAYGEASDVPAMLRALLSSDENERERGFSALFSTIYHQGTVYEASAYAVPFLQELLQSPLTPDPAGVAQLLCEMAEGASYSVALALVGEEELEQAEEEGAWHSVLAEVDLRPEAEGAEELRWVVATREAVGKALPSRRGPPANRALTHLEGGGLVG